MSGQDMEIKTADGDFSAYLSLPAAGKGPGVLVLQEIYGVNAGIRGVCDWLASEGFTALSPDLFWRIEPGLQLSDKTEAGNKRAFELFSLFDAKAGLNDIRASLATLRDLDARTGKAGAIGYCLGGLLAYQTACHTDSDASVGYYGVGIQDRLDDAAGITRPLMLHIAGKDRFVPAPAQTAIHKGLDGHAHVTLHDYPQQDHAFARVAGAHYDAAAATLANDRTLAFLRAHLG